MATHDYVIDNATGANVRADINLVLQAILTNNSSSSAPSTTAAYMWWADTTNGVLKIRNSSDNGWVELFQLDGTLTLEDGSNSSPALAFRDDLDTGIFSSSANTFCVATAGVLRMELGTASTNFNDNGEDVDFRIESDNKTHMFFIDAGNDRVGIGCSAPDSIFVVQDTAHTNFQVFSGSASTKGFIQTVQDSDLRIGASTDHPVSFHQGGLERFRYDDNGRFYIGTSANTFTGVGSSRLQISGTGADTAGANLIRTSDDGGAAFLQFTKNRNAATQANDKVGAIAFMGHDGTDTESYFAMIDCIATATATNNNTKGQLAFHTSNGSSVTSERLRLEPAGALTFVGASTRAGNTNSICSAGNNSIDINITEYFYLRHGNGTEILRARNTGRVGIGTTSLNAQFTVAASANTLVPVDVNDTSNTSTFTHRVRFLTGGTEVGRIRSSNSATAYDISASDITLKKNFEDWTENTLDLFKNINPQKFNFIQEDDGTTKSKGFIAQEMVDSFPEAYSKEDKKDSKYYFNPSGMVVYLMKAIQELEAKVAALEAT